MTDTSSKITTDLVADDPIDLPARYRIDANERRRMDNQAIGTQKRLEETTLRGYAGTWCDLDLSSADVVEGDTVCPFGGAENTVTKCNASTLADAGTYSGVVLLAAAKGTKVLVAMAGVVKSEITGLVPGAAGSVRINPTTSRLELAVLGASDYPAGTANTNGDVTLATGIPQGGLGIISGIGEPVTLVGTGTGPAGAFAIGDVLCSANDAADKTKVKLATAANLASADAASLRVLLEIGVATDTKQAAGPGDRIAPSVLGFSAAGTIDWAALDTTTGRAVRSTKAALTAAQYVLGEADLQGNTTIAPRAPGQVVEPTVARGSVLATRTSVGGYRGRFRGHYLLSDFELAGDGVTNDYNALVTMFSEVPKGATIMADVPANPANFYVVSGPRPLVLASDDNEGGNKNGIKFEGIAGVPQSGYMPTFQWQPTALAQGVAATVASDTGAAAGHSQPTLHLVPGVGDAPFTADHVGEFCQTWGPIGTTNVDILWIVAKVEGDGSAWLYSALTGYVPTYPDAMSGSIRYELVMPMLDARGRGCKVSRLSFRSSTSAGARAPAFVRVSQARGASASPITDVEISENKFWVSNRAVTECKYNLILAPPWVPLSTNVNYVTNANGVPRVASTAGEGSVNVSELKILRNSFSSASIASILHGSAGGQSVNVEIVTGTMNGIRCNYLQPTSINASAHAVFKNRVNLGFCEDFSLRFTASNRVREISVYSEAGGAICYDGASGSAEQLTKFVDSEIRSGTPHASGVWIECTHQGPVKFDCCYIGNTAADGTAHQIRLSGGVTNKTCAISFESCFFKGTSSWSGGTCATLVSSATKRGPLVLSGTEEWDKEVDPLHTGTGASAFLVLRVQAVGTGVTDITAAFNSTTNADATPFPAVEAAGDYMLVGFDSAFCGLFFDYLNGTAGVGGTVAFEFSRRETFTASTSDVLTHAAVDIPTFSDVAVSTTGTLPAPLTAATRYWTVRQSSSSSKLYPTLADAVAGTNVIDITTTGTGTHTIHSFEAFTGVSDASSGFTTAVADALETRWTMPVNSNGTARWLSTTAATLGLGADATTLYFARVKCVTTYSTNPVLDQGYVNHVMTFIFTRAALQKGGAGSLWMELSNPSGGNTGLEQVHYCDIAATERHQAGLYGWKYTAWAHVENLEYRGRSTTHGAASRLKALSHSRAGKVDMNTHFAFAGTAGGAAVLPVAEKTHGFVDAVNGTAVVRCKVSMKSCNAGAITGSAQIDMPTMVDEVFGDLANTDGGSRQIMTRTVAITQAAVAAIGAVTTGTVNVGIALPPDARIVGAEVNVTTKVQNAGDTDVTTVDVGIAGTADLVIKGVSLKTTGRKGESLAAGDSTGWVGGYVGAVQLIATLTSTVNLNTITAGALNVTVFYFVSP